MLCLKYNKGTSLMPDGNKDKPFTMWCKSNRDDTVRRLASSQAGLRQGFCRLRLGEFAKSESKPPAQLIGTPAWHWCTIWCVDLMHSNYFQGLHEYSDDQMHGDSSDIYNMYPLMSAFGMYTTAAFVTLHLQKLH